MNNKWFVILNPVANDGAGHTTWSKIKLELERNDFEFVMKETERKRHAQTITMDAIEQGYRNILTVGGDGTLSESVNGIFTQNQCHPNAVTSAHIPIGAINSWARHHKIPRDYAAWIPLIKSTEPSLHDLGVVNYVLGNWKHHWYFVGAAGCIYAGELAYMFNEKSMSVMNDKEMLFNVLHQLFKFKRQRLTIIHDDKKEFKGDFYNCNVGICSYSAGMRMTQHAIHDDGYLAITHDRGDFGFLRAMYLMYKLFTQKVFYDKRIEIAKTKKIEVLVSNPHTTICHVQADNEYLGQAPCTFEVKEKAWQVILPPVRKSKK